MARQLKFLFALIPLGVTLVSSQPARLHPKTPFVLNIDYARFRYDDKAGYIELYYAFYPRLLTFDLTEGKYRGGVKLRTVLLNKTTGEVAINEEPFIPMSVADTTEASFKFTFVSQSGYEVKFGQYELKLVVHDSLDRTRGDSLTLPLSVQPFVEKITMSDLELCSNITSSDNKNDLFYKNSLEVVPNPMLMFGVTAHPVLFDYAELYNLNSDSSYTVKTVLVDGTGKVVRESAKQRKYGVKNAVEVGTMNVSSFPSGRYRYSLGLYDGGGTEIARSTKICYIYNPHIQSPQSTYTSTKASELAGLSEEELAEEFREAQYLSTDQEIQSFKQITTADGRREFLAKFWTEIEQGKRGHLPITRTDYLQRVATANQRYHAMSREGWRTDRGRVYVLYGEPDEVQRVPSSEQSKPYETWSFYQIENGVLFAFIDRNGFGDYILVHSTKRGELHDDSWQRLLQ